MDTNSKIAIGEWFCADDGISIAERIHDFYYEEYDNIPEDKALGDLKYSLVEYKEFCGYEGKPKKRNRFRIFNLGWCSPITEEWEKVLNQSIIDHPKEYESFLKFLKVPKFTNDTRMVRYELSEENKLQVGQIFDKILQNIPPKFTFEDVINRAKEYQCPINFSEPLYSTYDIPCYLLLVLHFTVGEFNGKRVLFNRIGYKIYEQQIDVSYFTQAIFD